MKVSVSILKEKNNIEETIKKINNTNASFVHLDIMDGTFTNTTSFKLNELLNINSKKKYDIHIMSTNLDYQIKEAIKLKPEFITFHYESTKDVLKYIKLVKDNNIKVGLAINPKTRIWKVKKYFDYIDLLLIMSVEPGMGGQEFKYSVIKKINKIKKKIYNFLISVDGGINDKTIDYIKDNVDIVVSGSFITDSNNYDEQIDKLIN